MRYHLTPVRMAKMNKTETTDLGTDVEKGEPSYTLLMGMQTGAATVGNSMDVPQNVKNRTTLVTQQLHY